MKKYYYSYLENFFKFILPIDARVLRVSSAEVMTNEHFIFPSTQYDYLVLSDVLGYVDDVESLLCEASNIISNDGRLVITQYNTLWEPVLRLASCLRLRTPVRKQNWL